MNPTGIKNKIKFLYINLGYGDRGTFGHIHCRLLILSEFRKPSPVHGSSKYRSQPLQTHRKFINITRTHMRKKHQQEDQSVQRSQAREKNAVVVLHQNQLQQT